MEHSRWGFISRSFPSPAICPFLPEWQENLSWNRLCLKTAGPGLSSWVSNGRKKEGLRDNVLLDFFFSMRQQREKGGAKSEAEVGRGPEKNQKLKQNGPTILIGIWPTLLPRARDKARSAAVPRPWLPCGAARHGRAAPGAAPGPDERHSSFRLR